MRLRASSNGTGSGPGIGFLGLGEVMQSKRVLTEYQLEGIGCVVMESTYLEIFLEELIWALAGMNKESGKFFTDGLRLKARIELFGELGKARIKDKAKLAEFTAIISDLKIVADDRNAIVHGVWIRYSNFKESWAIAHKRRLKSPPLEFSPKNIHKTAKRISDLNLKVATFGHEEWRDLPVSWI